MKKLLTKRVFIVVGILALFAAAVAINAAKNKAAQTGKADADAHDAQPVISNADYYTAFRETRETTRNQEVAYLDSVIAQPEADDEMIKEANEQKLAIVECMESELTIESQLRAKGFTDAAVTFHKGSVTVIVDADELTSQQTAQILDIVMRETGEPAENIKVSVRR